MTPRSDVFNDPALVLFFFLVIVCCRPHGMDPSDHDSDKTADDEHDVQPSDLEELPAVDFLSWSSDKFDNSGYIQFMGLSDILFSFHPFLLQSNVLLPL